LLFGILALQADLIGQGALIAAMNAWTVNKTTPLGQILLGQGALDADGHALVEALVQRSLARHGDADKSLAALSSLGSARRDLEQLADPEVSASLAHVGPHALGAGLPTPPLDPEATVDRHSLAPGDGAGLRYRVLRPHAKGGLGEVFVAEDTELHREVALKEIQKEHATDTPSRARFLLEAEITGNLEHPGVVPVYGLGTYPDGRPFYAMRLVKGDSLKKAIENFHRREQPGRDPGERSLAFRELLGRFVDVCQAVAYAHSRGVLHRDLKPGNVMLGKYGETLVVDWGLAKPVGRAEPFPADGEVTWRPSSGSAAAATQAGTALGTPAYMSPEQAAGRLDQLGPASDIYSLGATLYALLTGQAPYSGSDKGEVLRQVEQGELESPRRVQPSIPAALEAICLKAMALRPAGRYGTALALAADVEHWLADEPVSAYREPLRLRARRWARRNKPAVAALAAAVLVALLLGGAGLRWAHRQAEERRQGVEEALAKAAAMQRQARWAEARAILEQAESRLGEEGSEDLRRRVHGARQDLDLVARLDAVRLKRATLSQGRIDIATPGREYAAVFQEAGLGPRDNDAGEVAARVRSSAVRQELVAALDDWAYCLGRGKRLDWVLAVARRADPDPWRDRVRSPQVWNSKRRLARLAQAARARKVPPRFLGVVGMQLKRLGGDGEALLRSAQERLPGDFWVTFELGNALKDKPAGEAAGYFRAALALRPGTAAVHNNLGNTLYVRGRLAAAVKEYRRAITLEPRYAQAFYNLANALQAQGRLARAVKEYRRAIAVEPKFVRAISNLGITLTYMGRQAEAVKEFRRAIARDPEDATVHSNLANALYSQGQLAEAVKECRRAIALDPKLAGAYNNLGVALHSQRKWAQAVKAFRRAIGLDPQDGAAHFNLGTVLEDQGQPAEAVAEYRRAIALDPKLAKAHYNLGLALGNLGRHAEAEATFRRVIARDPKLVEAYGALGQALFRLGRFAEARRATRRFLRLLPPDHGLRVIAARQLRQCRQLLALDRKLAAVLQGGGKPDGPVEQLNLAYLCQRYKKRYAAAARFFAEAFAAQRGFAADLRSGHGYNAACAAALAGSGRGRDAAPLDFEEMARLRGRALTWLRADLALRAKQLAGDKIPDRQAARQALKHWQQDPDLAGLRERAALAKLPQGERNEWTKLWAEVATLLKQAGLNQ
jgi:serine/threonine protein kinase/Flp pilus assembly protein TadD